MKYFLCLAFLSSLIISCTDDPLNSDFTGPSQVNIKIVDGIFANQEFNVISDDTNVMYYIDSTGISRLYIGNLRESNNNRFNTKQSSINFGWDGALETGIFNAISVISPVSGSAGDLNFALNSSDEFNGVIPKGSKVTITKYGGVGEEVSGEIEVFFVGCFNQFNGRMALSENVHAIISFRVARSSDR